jgi:hypothetical protein
MFHFPTSGWYHHIINTACWDFQKQFSKTQVARTYSFTYQGSRKQKNCSFNTTYFNFSHEAYISNKVTKTNPYHNNKQHATTSEGDHTNDGSGSISEGASANTQSVCHKSVTRLFLEHGSRQHNRCLGHQSLVPTALCQCSGASNNRKTNGIHSPHEWPRPTTLVKTRLQQRSRPPFSSNSRHSRNKHMFLCGT